MLERIVGHTSLLTNFISVLTYTLIKTLFTSALIIKVIRTHTLHVPMHVPIRDTLKCSDHDIGQQKDLHTFAQ